MNGFATCEAIFKAFQNTILKKGLWSLSTAALDLLAGGYLSLFSWSSAMRGNWRLRSFSHTVHDILECAIYDDDSPNLATRTFK